MGQGTAPEAPLYFEDQPTKAAVDLATAAIEAAQTSSDGKLDGIQDTLDTLATEAKLEAVRVILASLDGKDYSTGAKQDDAQAELEALNLVIGAQADAAATTDTATASLIALTKRLLQSVTSQVAEAGDTNTALGTLASAAGDNDVIGQLKQIQTNTDTVETKLQTLVDQGDTVETKLQSLIDNTDGVEAALGTAGSSAGANDVIGQLKQIQLNTDTAESKLQSVIDNTDGIEAALGTAGSAIGDADVIGQLKASNINLGAKADAAASNDTGSFNLIQLIKRVAVNLTTVDTSIGTTNTKLDTLNAKDFATSTKQDEQTVELQAINTNTADVGTSIGDPADAVASSDTGTFSLIALTKRLLQSMTSYFGTGGTGITAPTGAVGVLGWLSGIYDHVKNPYRDWENSGDDARMSIGSNQQSTILWQPSVLTENHLTVSNDVIGTVDGSTPLVGQVFKASADNVQEIALKLSASAPNPATLEDFESYANDAAIQAAWVSSDATYTQVSLDTGVFYAGSKAMKIRLDKNPRALNDKVTRTFSTNQNWSGLNTLNLAFRQEDTGKIQLRYRIIDENGHSISVLIPMVATDNTWKTYSFSLDNFTQDGGTYPNLAAVRKHEFEIVLNNNGGWKNVWIDHLVLEQDAGTLSLKLYDFGSNAEPASLSSGTPVTFDDGSTAKTVEGILNNPTTIRIDAEKGLFGNTKLTIGNYYAIVLTDLAVSGASVKVHGKTSGGYTSGKALTSTDGSVLTYESTGRCFFGVRSVPSSYVLRNLRVDLNEQGGDSLLAFSVVNVTTEKANNQLNANMRFFNRTTATLDFDQSPSKQVIDNNHALRISWSDRGSQATEINVSAQIVNAPIERNG